MIVDLNQVNFQPSVSHGIVSGMTNDDPNFTIIPRHIWYAIGDIEHVHIMLHVIHTSMTYALYKIQCIIYYGYLRVIGVGVEMGVFKSRLGFGLGVVWAMAWVWP